VSTLIFPIASNYRQILHQNKNHWSTPQYKLIRKCDVDKISLRFNNNKEENLLFYLKKINCMRTEFDGCISWVLDD